MRSFSVPLPLAVFAPPGQTGLPFHLSQAPRRLPAVRWVERQGPVLSSTPLSGPGPVLGLNVARGCAQGCAFCSVRPPVAGGEVVYAYRDTASRLAAELGRMARRPRAVHVSPGTDPFMPFAEVQEETARVVEVLAAHGVEAWLMTRGYVRPAALGVLAAHREWVRVTVGLTTLDRALRDALESLACPPRLRLRQIARLRQLGVKVQVALDPLVPGLTDTRENLTTLLDALAGVGVRHVSAGYMFLRQGIRDQLARALSRHGWEEKVLSAFDGGPVLAAPGLAPARYLPKGRRQRGYALLMALAATRDMKVAVNGTTNPDFAAARRTPVVPAARPTSLAGSAGALRA